VESVVPKVLKNSNCTPLPGVSSYRRLGTRNPAYRVQNSTTMPFLLAPWFAFCDNMNECVEYLSGNGRRRRLRRLHGKQWRVQRRCTPTARIFTTHSLCVQLEHNTHTQEPDERSRFSSVPKIMSRRTIKLLSVGGLVPEAGQML
jgi:hypothetical protein